MTDCPICCEQFNKSNHKEITCPYQDCNYSACKTCIRTFLLGTTLDPHCMNCKKGWDQQFIINNLNKSFCDKEYKNHRKRLLVDREISKLPETMDAADKQKKIIVEQQKMTVNSKKIKELNKELTELKKENGLINNKIYNIRRGHDNNHERRQFIMSCPNNNCRGYLSTQYKCDLCEMFTCPHCLELIGYNKNDPHTCNPDNIASAEMIKKDTKPCPQCGVRIHKIQGCNQMWCTQCKIAFNYVTLKIDTGIVHNPHYYQHLLQVNNGEVPRNPNDILCGGLCTVQAFNYYILGYLRTCVTHNIIEQKLYDELHVYITDIHRVISHITYHELPICRENVRTLINTESFRIDYILGNITKEELMEKIYRNDNKRKKFNNLLHIYELISVVGIERFKNLFDIAINNFTKNLEA